jgi:hypothetical protein
MDVIRYNTKEGMVYGLMVKKTGKKIHLILNDLPMRVKKVSINEEKFITVLDDASVKDTQKKMLKHGKNYQKMIKAQKIQELIAEGKDITKVKIRKMNKETMGYLKAAA